MMKGDKKLMYKMRKLKLKIRKLKRKLKRKIRKLKRKIGPIKDYLMRKLAIKTGVIYIFLREAKKLYQPSNSVRPIKVGQI
ncbi:hypothetical protein Q3G72_022917 [Acer saccharum]|nr:hypothetical protein Q3G72_022917 [Acer saccharum]